MRQSPLRPTAAAFVTLGFALLWTVSALAPVRAETFSVANSDYRNYLYFQVPEATVRRVLPDSWQAAPAQSGPVLLQVSASTPTGYNLRHGKAAASGLGEAGPVLQGAAVHRRVILWAVRW